MRKLSFEVLEKINQGGGIHDMANGIRITARALGLTLATVFLMFVSNNGWAQSPSAKGTIKALKTELGIDSDRQNSDITGGGDGDGPDPDGEKKHPYEHNHSIGGNTIDTTFIQKYNNLAFDFNQGGFSWTRSIETNEQKQEIIDNVFSKLKQGGRKLTIRGNYDTYPTERAQQVALMIINQLAFNNDMLEDNGFMPNPTVTKKTNENGTTSYYVVLTSLDGKKYITELDYEGNHIDSNIKGALFIVGERTAKGKSVDKLNRAKEGVIEVANNDIATGNEDTTTDFETNDNDQDGDKDKQDTSNQKQPKDKQNVDSKLIGIKPDEEGYEDDGDIVEATETDNDGQIVKVKAHKCKPNKLNAQDAQRFVYDFKQKSQDRTAENYCPVMRYFVTPAAVTQAGGNLGTRMADVTGAINNHDNQSYIDHNYTFTNESGGAINVSGLTMSETNSQGDNNVWFTGITQDELLYNLTVYQYDQGWDLGLAICLQASTENGNPEQANLIEGENITGTAGAVMMVKLTSGGGFDNVRCVHGFSCHIRGATHPDNPTDTPHAPSAAVNFATASPNNILWKGTGGAYLGTTTSVNTNGSPNIAPCAPLALTDIINFSGTAVKEGKNRLSLLSVQAQNDGESARGLLERFVLTSDLDSGEWEGERRTLSYSEIDLSNKPKGAISFNIRDRWPSLGEVNYYRLKIIDKDGAVSYSNEIEPVDHRHKVEGAPMESDTDFKIFGTLADNSVHFDLGNNERGFNNGCLLDANGKVIRFFQVPNGSYEGDIDVSNLPAGTYFLSILDKEGKNCSKKFIVY